MNNLNEVIAPIDIEQTIRFDWSRIFRGVRARVVFVDDVGETSLTKIHHALSWLSSEVLSSLIGIASLLHMRDAVDLEASELSSIRFHLSKTEMLSIFFFYKDQTSIELNEALNPCKVEIIFRETAKGSRVVQSDDVFSLRKLPELTELIKALGDLKSISLKYNLFTTAYRPETPKPKAARNVRKVKTPARANIGVRK